MSSHATGGMAEPLSLHELEGELTIYDPETQKAYFLNSTGTALWHLLDGSTQAQVVEALAGEFHIQPREIAGEVAALLDQLADLGLLEERHPPRRRP